MADTVLRITPDMAAAQAALRQLITSLGQAETAAKGLEKSFSSGAGGVDKLNSSMKTAGTTGNSLISVFSGLTAALGIGQIIRAADTFTQYQNTIKSVSNNQEELQKAMEGVAKIANETGTPLKDVGTLYTKLTVSGQQLGISQDRILRATEGVSKQLKLFGLGAAEAQSVMYQFGQAVGLGYARMEEMKQIMEASPAFMKKMAEQFGKTTTQFLADVAAYKVGSEDLINAQARMAGTPMWREYQQTVGDAITKVSNNWQIFLGRLESSTGAFSKLANAIDFLGKNIDILVAVGTAFFTMFAIKKIMDISTAFATLNGVMKANPWILAATVILSAGSALAAYLGISKEAEKVIRKEEEAQKDLNDAKLEYVGIKIDEVALRTAAETYGKQQQFLTSIAGLSKNRQDQEKAIAEFAKAQTLEYELIVKKAPAIAKMIRDQVAARQNAELRAQVENDLVTIGKEIEIINARGLIQQEQLRAIEKIRAQTGIEISGQIRKDLENAIAKKVVESEIVKSQKESANTRQLFNQYNENILKLSTQELDVYQKIQEVWNNLGPQAKQFTVEQRDRLNAAIKENEEYKKKLDYLKEIRKNLETATTPQEGMQAAATTSGKLGDLSGSFRIKQIETERQTLMNGIKDLYSKGAIQESTYAEARISIEQRANAEILASRQAMMEQQMKMQGVTNSEIVNMVKDQMAAVAMMQQGGIVGVQGALSAMTNVFDLMKNGNKQSFETYKSLATAQALISTYQAAAMSIAAPPGPPFSYIYVASAILAGMAQVAKIRSMQYSGRAVGGPVVGGQSYIVGEKGPEIFTPGSAGGIIKNSDIGRSGVNVNFNISANDAQGFDQLLINRRGLITQIISDAMADSGKRM